MIIQKKLNLICTRSDHEGDTIVTNQLYEKPIKHRTMTNNTRWKDVIKEMWKYAVKE